MDIIDKISLKFILVDALEKKTFKKKTILNLF